jgi:hypothetical protein
VTYCPDLLSHNEHFDYNQIVSALSNHEMTSSNITIKQFVHECFTWNVLCSYQFLD